MADRQSDGAQRLQATSGESAEWIGIAETLIAVGRPDKAPEVFQNLTGALPERPQLHYDVISGLCERGPHLRLLKDVFERAAGQDAADASTLYALGLTRQIDGDPNGALAAFAQALQRDPALAAVHHNVAVVFLTQNRLSEAVAAAEAAVRKRPDMAEPYFVIGSIHMAERRLAQSYEALQKFVLLARTPDLAGPAQQASATLAI